MSKKTSAKTAYKFSSKDTTSLKNLLSSYEGNIIFVCDVVYLSLLILINEEHPPQDRFAKFVSQMSALKRRENSAVSTADLPLLWLKEDGLNPKDAGTA